MAVIRYALGRLTLEKALQLLSRRLGLLVGAIILPFPEAAVDVDTIDDWELVKAVAAGGRKYGVRTRE